MKRAILVCILAILGTASCMEGWKPRYTIIENRSNDNEYAVLEGVVYDCYGEVAPNAYISLKRHKTFMGGAVSDSEGHFLIKKIQPGGQYRLSISYCTKKFLVFIEDMTLNAGAHITILCYMPKPGCESLILTSVASNQALQRTRTASAVLDKPPAGSTALPASADSKR